MSAGENYEGEGAVGVEFNRPSVFFTWVNIVWRAVAMTFHASICTKSKLVRVKGGREAGPRVLCIETFITFYDY